MHPHTHPFAGNLHPSLLSENSPVSRFLSSGRWETQRPEETECFQKCMTRCLALMQREEVMPLDPISVVRAGGRRGGMFGGQEAKLEAGF